MDKIRLKRRLEKIIPFRLHMSLMCILTITSGILLSKLLLMLEFQQPAVRYGLAVFFSYGVFFCLIYLWLQWYFDVHSKSGNDGADGLDLVDVPVDPGALPPAWKGYGGEFSGGGASGAWDGADGPLLSPAKSSSQSEGASAFGDFDESAVILGLLAIIALISGSALYLVYQAPEILLEAMFEFLLIAGLVRDAKQMRSKGWAYSIFQRTWRTFAVVLIIAVLFGFAIKKSCPEAISFSQYRSFCLMKE